MTAATGWGQAPESVMVVEAHSGRILIANESTLKRPVASLTKIATALVALDWAKAAGVDIDEGTRGLETIVADSDDADALASLAGDLKINEVVDTPHMLVSMHMPKAIFR